MAGNSRVRLNAGERQLLLVVGDIAAAIVGAGVALILWGQLDFLGPTADFVRTRAPWFIFLPLLWPIFMVNLYDVHRAGSWRATLRGVFFAAAAAGVAYLIIFFIQEGSIARRAILYFLTLTVALTLVWRWIYIRVFTAATFMRRVIVVGAGEGGRALLAASNLLDPKPFELIGLIDDNPEKQGQEIEGAQVVGTNGDLLGLAQGKGVTDIVVAIQGPISGEMFQALLDAQEKGIDIVQMPLLYEELFGRVPIQHLESDWILRSFVDQVRVSRIYALIKRFVDIAGGVFGLLASLLIVPWACLAILIETGRPVFIIQARMGQGGKHYNIVKLRTMFKDAEPEGEAIWAMEEDPRVTRVGRILRKTFIDELPQFWNVLRGDMSLAGPRPERPELIAQLQKKIPFYRARLLVKPGVSGWAQVNYSKGASIEGSAEKLEYDLYYIKHRGVVMDTWIILRTIGSVFGFRGV